MSVVIVYGSVGGNTELVAQKVYQTLVASGVETVLSRVETTNPKETLKHDIIILASPTYYHGETEANFPSFLHSLKQFNLTGKKFLAIGLGDKKYYPEYLCDAAKVFEDFVEEVGGQLLMPSLRVGTNPVQVLATTIENWAKRVAAKALTN